MIIYVLEYRNIEPKEVSRRFYLDYTMTYRQGPGNFGEPVKKIKICYGPLFP